MAEGAKTGLKPVWLRDMSLSAADDPPFVSAASGLVRIAGHLYVIADDALHMAVFEVTPTAPGRLIPLLSGNLPADRKDRKRLKPDFEALVHLPAGRRFAQGALLALGSGSTERRHRGVVVALDASGSPVSPPREIDLAVLHRRIGDMLPDLNLEGAAVAGDRLLLFQRGNITHPRNYMIALDLEVALGACLDGGGPVGEIALTELHLGSARGVPFTVTDAAAIADGGLVLTVSAEDTADSYHDGVCVGGGVAVLSSGGAVLALHEFDRPLKAEGVAALPIRGGIDLLLVTDADDPTVPAGLYAATVPRP